MQCAAICCASGFPRAQVLRLWEALWAGVPGLHLYLCVAALEHHRRQILRWVLHCLGGRESRWQTEPRQALRQQAVYRQDGRCIPFVAAARCGRTDSSPPLE